MISPIVRTGPRKVSFNDIEVYSQIYKGNSKFPKSKDLYNFPPATQAIFGTINIQEAHARRVVFAPYFSKQAVRKLEGLVQSKATRFLDRLQDIGADINITSGFRCFSADVVTAYSYDTCFDALSHPNFAPD
ncbi:hypothetical protein H072_5922 [Dactylellina haptotyla CBS 200.50]|uniref:Uncharacterized protein n=1 Tax=Dactylellina haptotyla (strain CBS 200.50) TaxID=1284197 RepID=S8BLI8_DACHA|nr:hypothetical protein H072_5922 [Dactylellina haptotyla CBS 200.50]